MQGLYFDTVKEPIKKGERVFSVIWMTGKKHCNYKSKTFFNHNNIKNKSI